MRTYFCSATLALLLTGPVSADAGKITFCSDRTGNREIFVMNPDGTGSVNITKTPSANDENPSWSPNGAKLIFQRGDSIIGISNADGTSPVALNIGHFCREAEFRPHSDQITYTRYGGYADDFYINTRDGSTETRFLAQDNPYGEYHLGWTKDASKVVYYTFDGLGPSPNIYTANGDGTGQKQLTTTNADYNPRWSPDGSRIVFQSYRFGKHQIYVMNADGTGEKRLTENNFNDTWPTFSPDGTKIAFVSDRTGNNEIFVMNADGTGQKNISNNPADDNAPCWGLKLAAGTPAVSVTNAAVTEGNLGTVNLTFKINLSAAFASPINVTYRTFDGTAKAGEDYSAVAPATVTFAPGQVSKSVTVQVKGDTIHESNETFGLRIATTEALINKLTGTGTITNDDALPTLSIGKVTVVEGNSGVTQAIFPVTLSAFTSADVSVPYQTSNGTASQGTDYMATSGTLVIPAGQTSGKISVPVLTDEVSEPDETFTVTLGTPENATIIKGTATGTITNDDTKIGVSISDATVPEGDKAVFVLTLSSVAAVPVTVTYATQDDTATAGLDYTAASRSVTIPAGQTSTSILITTLSDTQVETSETFFVNLTPGANAALVDAKGKGTITDEDAPQVYVSDATLIEGKSGFRTMCFTIALSEPALGVAAVNYSFLDGTAQSGSDYRGTAGTVQFSGGNLTNVIPVQIMGDTTLESDEYFNLNLSGAVNCKISKGTGRGTITDDDAAPKLTINDIKVTEGNSGTQSAVFTLTLTNPSQMPVTVSYATQDGTATAGSDYTAASGLVTITPGQTTQTITVGVKGDTVVEGNETFSLQLSDLTNAVMGDAVGVATITNDDAASPGSKSNQSAQAPHVRKVG